MVAACARTLSRRYRRLVNAACLPCKLALKDEALQLLERVFARGWGKRDWIEHGPRFKKLLANLKLQSASVAQEAANNSYGPMNFGA